jgi:prepilin-type N-terminal cleavage/methylation domain-containing protein
MPHQARRGEQGFTLIELLISIVVSGIIMSALVTGFIVVLRASAGAHDRFVASNGSQTLATYFTSDVQSANPTMVSTAAVGTGCSASTPLPAGSTNLLRLQWTEMTTATKMTAFSVSYRTEPDGSDWRITRYYCTAAQDPVAVTADALLLSAAPASHVMATPLSSPTAQTAVTDGGTTNNSFTVTSATAGFSAADIGQTIAGSGIPAGTAVAAVVDSSTATLSAKSTVTATGVALTLNRSASASVSGRNISMILYSSVSTGQKAPYGYRLSADMRKSPDQAFTVTAVSPQTAGAAFTVTVTALKNGATDTTYNGTVHFTSTDPQAVLPADYTFVAGDNGVRNFANAVTLKNAPSQAVTATDTTKAWMAGSATVTVNPGAMNSFSVGAPTTTASGVPFTATVKALDVYGNTATGYTGTVQFTSTDGLALLPANYAFVAGDAGVHTFTNGVTLRTSPSQTVTVKDTVQTAKTGQVTVTVTAPIVSALSVTAPASSTAGTAITVVVTAKDSLNNTVTNYTGTVHFTTGDPAGVVPSDYTFVAGDNGVRTFTSAVTFKTTPSQTVTATDTVQSTVTGNATVAVGPGALNAFVVTSPVSSSAAGTPFNLTVTAKDSFGNTISNYAGRVHLASTDAQAGLAADYTFVAGDSGSHTLINGVTLKTAGSRSVTVNDTVQTTETGSVTITVTAGPPLLQFTNCSANSGAAGSCASVTVGKGFMDGYVSVGSQDAYGNTVTISPGSVWTIQISSDDANFVVTASPVTITAPTTQSATRFHVDHASNGAGSANLTAHATSGSAVDGTMVVKRS